MKIPQPSDPVQPIPQAIPTDIDGFVFCLVNMYRVLKSNESLLCVSIGLKSSQEASGSFCRVCP